MDAKKLKLIVKGEKRPTFGTDPNEPWSVRAGITESEKGELHAYLKSRGINPDFVSKDTKISHAKSSEFHKWRRDHQFDDPINFVSTTVADKMKQQRAQTEEVEQIEEKNVPTSPEKWARAKAAAKSKFAVYPSAYANGWASKKYKAMGGGWKSVSEESEQLDELAPETLASYVLKTSSKDPNRAEPRKKAMSKLAKTMAKRPVDPNAPKYSTNIFGEEKKPKMTALDRFRKAAAEREKKHSQYEKPTGDLKGAIDRLEKHLNKEEIEITEKNDSHTHAAHYEDPKTGEWTGMNLLIAKDDEDAIRQANEKCKEGCRLTKVERHITVKENAGISKSKETSFHKKLDKLVHKTFGKRKDEMKMKEEVINEISKSEVEHHFHNWTNSEHAPYNSDAGDDNKVHQSALSYLSSTNVPKEKHEKMAMHIAHKFHGSGIDEEVEQIDELKMSTVKSYHKKRLTDFSYSNKKPGETSTKPRNARIKKVSAGVDRSIDRQTGRKPTSEDVFQDTQAATQTAFDMGTQADDREPTYSKRKEMSKSARMIKSLYRKHKMVKEDLYDHEKEDKSVAAYGKKPKVEKQEVYDDDTQAAMVLKGGKTLTGQTRDTLEIDPVMRKPVKPDSKEKT